MKLSFLIQHNILNVAAISVLMPAMAVGSVIARQPTDMGTPALIMSHEEMMHWIANTDAKLTFIGESINPLSSRSAQVTTVTFCSSRVGNLCGGPCSVYTGGATCLYAPDTNCLAATNDVGFCSGGKCGQSCNDYSSCGTRLDDGYCYTPGTNSIIVTNA